MSKTTCLKKSLKEEALNCLENKLMLDEISIEEYEIVCKALHILGKGDFFDLGDGIKLSLIDELKED